MCHLRSLQDVPLQPGRQATVLQRPVTPSHVWLSAQWQKLEHISPNRPTVHSEIVYVNLYLSWLT